MRIRIALIIATMVGVLAGLITSPATAAANDSPTELTLQLLPGAVQVEGQVGEGDHDDSVVSFYTDCDAWRERRPASTGLVDYGWYQTAVVPGTYKVRMEMASDADFQTSWHPNATDCESAQTVTIGSEETTLHLRPKSFVTVTGKVTTSAGVVFFPDIDFFRNCADAESGVTPERQPSVSGGDYVAKLTSTGPYRVRITTENGSSWHPGVPNCSAASNVAATNGATVDLTAMVLSPNVTGTVTGSSLTSKARQLSFFRNCPTDRFEWSEEVAVQNGSYQLYLPDGTYRVRVEQSTDHGYQRGWHGGVNNCADSTPVVVSGHTTANINVANSALVSGTATRGTSALTAGSVLFFADCQSSKPTARGTISKGQYAAELRPGKYRVWLQGDSGSSLSSWRGANDTCAESPALQVSGNATVNLTTEATTKVTGTVSSRGTPIGTGRLSFFSDCYIEDSFSSFDVRGVKFSAGTFTTDLPPGKYRVFIDPASGEAAVDSWHSNKQSCADAQPVTVTANSTLALDASPKHKIVTGSVTSAAGPVKIGTISLYRDCAAWAQGEPAHDKVPIANGSFSLDVATEGSYKVWIKPDFGSGAAWSWNGATSSCAAAPSVEFTAGATANLIAATGYDVHVVSPNSYTDYDVAFYSDCAAFAAGSPTGAMTMSGRRGWEITLPGGTYKVHVTTKHRHVGMHGGRGGSAHSWHGRSWTCANAATVRIPGAPATTPDPDPSVGVPGGPDGPGGPSDSDRDPSERKPQSIKLKAPAKMPQGKRLKVPRQTRQGTAVVWRTKTPKTCRIVRSQLRGRKAGWCKVVAKAPGSVALQPLKQKYRIRVKG